jgi:DNA-binding transcriptional LysR family regulator
VLTSRRVDLIEEGLDVAFRIGALPDSSLVATKVADARLAFVAAPAYLRRRGRPRAPADLAGHDCVALVPEGTAPRWAFADGDGVRWLPIQPRLQLNHLGLALQAALSGLGIANLPLFACAEALRAGTLRAVLQEHAAAFGGIYVVHVSRRVTPARVRRFVELAAARLRGHPALAMTLPAR